jgi:hypothetical protein
MKEKNVKQFLLENWYQWERGEYKDGVEEANMVDILCTYI